MPYQIDFEDHGQDLLHITCDDQTGLITSAGPYHSNRYADGKHFVELSQLHNNRIVWFQNAKGGDNHFRWPMVRLTRDGVVLAEAPKRRHRHAARS